MKEDGGQGRNTPESLLLILLGTGLLSWLRSVQSAGFHSNHFVQQLLSLTSSSCLVEGSLKRVPAGWWEHEPADWWVSNDQAKPNQTKPDHTEKHRVTSVLNSEGPKMLLT